MTQPTNTKAKNQAAALLPGSNPGLPCLLFEDDHLLVVNKPAGLNTHRPAPYAGEGLYDWLRHREPRWASLAIVQRLDKETSGVLVFAKSPLANRSLTEQFTRRQIQKKYLLLTDRSVSQAQFSVVSNLVRAGAKYVSRPAGSGGQRAETHFKLVAGESAQFALLEAQPITGRTHQIRVQAAVAGMPILGDVLYGGTPFARLCLHAAELLLDHPASGQRLSFSAPADFHFQPCVELRRALLDPAGTNAFRLVHGAADNYPGWYVDRLGAYFLVQRAEDLRGNCSTNQSAARGAENTGNRDHQRLPNNLALLLQAARQQLAFSLAGAYRKILTRQIRRVQPTTAAPYLLAGQPAPARFVILENGVSFELSFQEGYSVGLFLDQRDNRRRFLTGHVAANFPLYRPADARESGGPAIALPPPEILNVFAYTCAFSVCAALAGAHTTSLDLSTKYLHWGRRNFALNGLDPAQHDFIYGDAFDWLKRLAKKPRCYEVVVLDPPTFSQSKKYGAFRAEKDYGALVAKTLPLLKRGGVLFASTNAASLAPERFVELLQTAIGQARRKIAQIHYVPQPPDFPVARDEPAYLKTVWLRVG